MNLFDVYGIKEVADVAFYDTVTGRPSLYFDTLKVSTIESGAEQASANGGKGNAPLIVWDYGKNITVTLEDALFSMKSLALMYGGKISSGKNTHHVRRWVAPDTSTTPDWAPQGAVITDQTGKLMSSTFTEGEEYLVSWVDTEGTTEVITINAESFPGTYKVVGTTYARNRKTGKDEFFQFVIPLAKVNSDTTLTMQAEGDPSTFSMTLQVLKPEDGNMMELIKLDPKKEKESLLALEENLIVNMGG